MLSSLLQNFNKIWLSIVALNLILLVLLPDWFSKESIVSLLDGLGAFALVTYIVVSLARALLLLPITPFIIAGAISFPGMPGIIWIISTISVVVGAGVVYSFPSFGGYDKYLEKNHPKAVVYLKQKILGKHAFWVIVGWSFFPAVPTDAICYVSGIASYPFKRLMIPLLIGELPIVTAYVFLGIEISDWLRL